MYMCRITVVIAVTAALGWIASGCASIERHGDAPRRHMSVPEARHLLAEKFSAKSVIVSRDGITLVGVTGDSGTGDAKATSGFLPFSMLTDLAVERESEWAFPNKTYFSRILANGRPLLVMGKEVSSAHGSSAESVIDAFLVLKDNALAPEIEEADFKAFSTAAKSWLATKDKPAMTDEVLTYKVLAEDAFKKKDFHAALKAYDGALERYPLWPEGQFNAALLAAEIGDYEAAAHHMRRYLVLAPDAQPRTSLQLDAPGPSLCLSGPLLVLDAAPFPFDIRGPLGAPSSFPHPRRRHRVPSPCKKLGGLA